MIKASELRIGNWYNDQRINRDFVVHEIRRKFVDHGDTDYSPTSIDNAEGIELTPEWLERFGFELVEVQNEQLWQLSKVALTKNEYRLYISDTEDDWHYTTSIVIKTAHQLQNLFFALTGRELELKK